MFALLIPGSTVMLGQKLSGLTIIGKDIGVKSISEQQVMDAFRAKNNLWSNGRALTVCLPESQSSDAAEVCFKLYGKSVSEVKKFWLSQVFQGRSRSPFFFESDREMLDFIAKTPGAIGAFINDKAIAIPADLQLQITP